MKIHATAIVDPHARIAPDAEIGPFAVIGADVEIGPGCWVGPHAVITGHTRLGANNRVYQFASLGEAPQDKKYGGEPTRLEIGNNNTIREFCTFNCGTVQDAGVTRIGSDNWIMAYVHLAHDCQIGDHTIFANNAQLAGHVHVGDYAILGGFTAVHQFCHIGAHSISGISSVVLQDVPPYVTISGNPAKPYGINAEGLKRRGFDPATIIGLKRAYKTLYRSGLTLDQAKSELARQASQCPEAQALVDFLAGSVRGIVR
ncbi:MAG: acyl-ACP--UDP-N-acetylglucosamine O-acyltransferase [Betaproteobacteria bacterium]|nr:acyl-ACP--UDP-N-acetylglucosamine O-acyltransferase [Betaproteobacteria bacterium]